MRFGLSAWMHRQYDLRSRQEQVAATAWAGQAPGLLWSSCPHRQGVVDLYTPRPNLNASTPGPSASIARLRMTSLKVAAIIKCQINSSTM